LECFLNKKFNKEIRQDNISAWRRTVCGDLTAAFSDYKGGREDQINFLKMDPFIEKIYNAKFQKAPKDYKILTPEEIAQINRDPASSSLMTHQEPGTRPACPLPYQLYADGRLSEDKKSFELNMEARNEVFGKKSAGAPFKVYAPGKYLSIQAMDKLPTSFEGARSWDYSVTAGGGLSDNWPLNAFEEDGYHLRVYGPNGFYREFLGTDADPALQVKCDDERSRMLKSKLTGNAALKISNLSQDHSYNLEITDNAYQNKPVSRSIAAGSEMSVTLDLKKSFGWYDFTLRVKEFPAFSQRFAGRVETGKESHSDPAMGREIS
jgi:phospholipase C